MTASRLFVLSELTLPLFLWAALAGRKPRLLHTAPLLPPLEGALKRIADWAIGSGRAAPAVELVPELWPVWEYHMRLYFLDFFRKYEPWQDTRFGFAEAEARDPAYGYAFKQVTCKYTFEYARAAFFLGHILKRAGDRGIRVTGAPGVLLGVARAYFEAEGESLAPVRAARIPRRTVNSVLALGIAAASAIAVLRQMRLKPRRAPVDLAFDHCKDIREYAPLQELAEVGKVLLVDRFPAQRSLPLPANLDATVCTLDAGVFAPADALRAAGEALRDVTGLWRRYRRLHPAHFYRMATLPRKRLAYRALFNRYPPRHFLGRDEYNVEHILRRGELQRIGVPSLGLTNGFYTTWTTFAPNVRYVAFDRYFLFCRSCFTGYHDTWAPFMRTEAVGSYAISRDRMQRLRNAEGEAILFTFRVAFSNPEWIRMVRATAAAFPERQVLLQFKGGLQGNVLSERDARRSIEACCEDRPNVEHTTDNVYDLMERAKYHISDVSGIVAEAIQGRVKVFLADLLDMEFSTYRQLPGLSVHTAEELVERLQAFENGTAEYPHEAYLRALDLDDTTNAHDILRRAVGLPAAVDSADKKL